MRSLSDMPSPSDSCDCCVARRHRVRPIRRVLLQGLAMSAVWPAYLPAASLSPQPWAIRRARRQADLARAHQALLEQAAREGRLLTGSTFGQSVQRLADPIFAASRAIRPDWPSSGWRLDVVVTADPQGTNVLTFGRQELVVLWPAGKEMTASPGSNALALTDLLAALIAHGVAHGLREHALETDALADGLPGYDQIAEREADRDTTELLARAGSAPRLAWTLRDTLSRDTLSRETPARDMPAREAVSRDMHGGERAALRTAWSRTHPEPSQAREAIERFSQRVSPLQGIGALHDTPSLQGGGTRPTP